MKRALDRIQIVITDTSVSPGNDQQQQQHSPAALSVNAADSGISLSQLQTTAFRAVKDFEVFSRCFRVSRGIRSFVRFVCFLSLAVLYTTVVHNHKHT